MRERERDRERESVCVYVWMDRHPHVYILHQKPRLADASVRGDAQSCVAVASACEKARQRSDSLV